MGSGQQAERETVASTAAVKVVTANAGETRRVGRCLGALLRPGDVLLLEGPFGAGKTTLTQGIARGLGIRERVTSPSFTLVNQYQAEGRQGPALYHIDLYRIPTPAEVFELGLEEYLNERAVCVVEWPEQARDVLVANCLELKMAFLGDSGRTIELVGTGSRYEEIVRQFGSRCSPMTIGEGGRS